MKKYAIYYLASSIRVWVISKNTARGGLRQNNDAEVKRSQISNTYKRRKEG